MPLRTQAIQILDDWYKCLKLYQDRLPARGTVTAALHVLERLRSDYDLDISSHVAGGQSQITGVSSSSLQRLLARFGETRRLSSVAGRSNRGARGTIEALLVGLKELRLEHEQVDVRDEVLKAMQSHIVSVYISVYFSVKRVKATYDRGAPTWQFIEAILNNARQSGKAGAVAEYLVGAKLALIYPDMNIRNKQFSTSDVQGGFSGDFEIGDTVFHVTVAPTLDLFEKCKTNLERGLRVYILIPSSQCTGVREHAKLFAANRIAVESIESFVAMNIDEVSKFHSDQVKKDFLRLLDIYNARVEQVELDKSMLIEIPPNLK